MEWEWTSGGQGGCLEGLEAGGQVVPVVQEELFTSLEGGVELRGEAGHIGGHILENARGGLVVVRHLQDREPQPGRVGWVAGRTE